MYEFESCVSGNSFKIMVCVFKTQSSKQLVLGMLISQLSFVTQKNRLKSDFISIGKSIADSY